MTPARGQNPPKMGVQTPSLGRRGPSRAEAAMRGVGMGQQMPRATSSTEPHHQPSRLWADSEPVLGRVALDVARAMEIARGEVCTVATLLHAQWRRLTYLSRKPTWTGVISHCNDWSCGFAAYPLLEPDSTYPLPPPLSARNPIHPSADIASCAVRPEIGQSAWPWIECNLSALCRRYKPRAGCICK